MYIQGCYVDSLLLYGGWLEAGQLKTTAGQPTGPRGSSLGLWSTVHRVKLTPVELSRVGGAGVVKIPLHTRYLCYTG